MLNSASPRWFDTVRGIRSHRHGIRRLQRIVLERSQCAETAFEMPWEAGRSITCVDSCRRLPSEPNISQKTAAASKDRENIDEHVRKMDDAAVRDELANWVRHN
ncbi:hypothetical protein ASG25_21200 [Rhizobium sp. Leaf384]|uniref:hypothetical protein n=1 Tax=Rhizobium sp. Leaf384 TaxID=1736358 RepID=UPI0007125C1D|nr:hypothetical protein [Rhizobium sp. Leaf384]KQS74316.1 hypothetical protein ASG25_21200 [Rhizobium sp. Leaf384]KQS83959.1 hypothetical protein ASG58_21580 [Rhizobium sp. Leaf383]